MDELKVGMMIFVDVSVLDIQNALILHDNPLNFP